METKKLNEEELEARQEHMIDRVHASAREAARRNRHKDTFYHYRYSDMPPANHLQEGWHGLDGKFWISKFNEEIQELLNNPTDREAGDVVWMVAMFLDDRKPKEKKDGQ